MLLRSKSILRRKSAEEDGVGRSVCAYWWCAALLLRSGNARWSAASIETAGRSCPVGQFAMGCSSKEPLNNSLCPVSARCISRNLHLVKVISVQNGHYFSAFLLLFLKKGRLPLYQVAESFRPAMASAYKLAQANIAYSRFSFFFKPRYTVFL